MQRLRQECSIAGSGPTTTINQSGQLKKLVDWTDQAWIEIQNLHDNWMFLRKQFSFDTVADVGEYTPSGSAGTGAALTDHRLWHKDTLRCQRTSLTVADQQWLVEWDYPTFRNTYRFNLQAAGRPVVFAERYADRALMFGSVPDDAYTITGEYQATPVEFSANDDEPAIRSGLHMIIVYKAMLSYGLDMAATDVIARAQAGYSSLLTQLEREQLPSLMLGSPLA